MYWDRPDGMYVRYQHTLACGHHECICLGQ
jgi:hypothetical protein